MKRKNIMPTNVSEEESSEDEQLSDNDFEMEGEEEESVVDSSEDEEVDDIDDDEEDDTDDDEEDDTDDDEEDEEALDASATDSDEDESDMEDDEEEEVEPPKSKSEIVKEQILQRYQERQGKQLFIRFPHKVPETQEALEEKVKELTPLVVKVHKPRQRHVRFCLVDFATNEDRNTALKELKKSIKKGTLDAVNIPRTENTEFVSELAERKLKSLENKKAKLRLKKASKKALRENHFTSTIIVRNLPKTASALQIREIFPNAVDINIKAGKGIMNRDKSIAAITLPTTLDARNAIKKKISLEGNQLVIRFDNQKLKKKNKKFNKKDDSKPITDKNEIKYEVESEPSAKKPRLEAITPEATKTETLTKQSPVNKNNKNQNKKVNKNKLKKVTK